MLLSAMVMPGVWFPARNGLRMYDTAAGEQLLYRAGWQNAQNPALPTGGTVVDAKARTALEQLVTALQNVGVLTSPTP
jgi:hypothetical protein